jgi:hypothetical protein
MATEQVDEDRRRWSGAAQRRWGHLADELHRRLGPGASLGAGARAAFEGRLGGDLSAAMVHRSPLAGQLARGLGAEALSTGDHVLGGDDALDPTTLAGASLLGHELTHVLQRTTDASGELEAQVVERALTDEVHSAEAGSMAVAAVDPEVLAERVYQRLLDQVRLERDRAAWIA